jgi:hypothetical protein
MNKKWMLFLLSAFFLLLGGCPPYYGTYDVHYVYYQNNSSYNINIQYFLNGDWYTQWYNYDGADGNVYRITVDKISIAEKYYVGISTSDYNPIDKILIVDADNHRLLRKIEDESFLYNLPADKRTEKRPDETVTYYDHHFIITDDFLNE